MTARSAPRGPGQFTWHLRTRGGGVSRPAWGLGPGFPSLPRPRNVLGWTSGYLPADGAWSPLQPNSTCCRPTAALCEGQGRPYKPLAMCKLANRTRGRSPHCDSLASLGPAREESLSP